MLANPSTRPKQAGYIAPAVNLLLTTLAVAAVTLVARDPLYSRPIQRAPVQQPDEALNLLCTTLSTPVVAAPFIPGPFTDPTRARYVQQPDIQRALPISVLGQDPFRNLLPGDTIRRGAAQQFSQGHVPPDKLLPPFKVFDTQAVRGVARQQPDLFPDLLGTTLATTPAQDPFRPVDLAQQLRRLGALQTDLFPDLLGTTLATTPAQDPFRPVDFSIPSRARAAQQPDLVRGLPIEVLGQSPFVPVDYGLPRRARAAQQPENVGVPPDQLLPPFIPSITTMVVRREGVQQTAINNLLETTLFTQSPFSQLDWQAPVQMRRVQQPDIPQNNPDRLTPVVTGSFRAWIGTGI